MARAVGAGTRLPRREVARAAGLLAQGGAESVARRGGLRGAERRVSCVLWTLETLARSWPGQTAPMARAAGAGTRLPRRERARAACTVQPRTHGASGGRGDAPAAAGAGARGVHVAAPHPWRAYPRIYRPKRATPRCITTRRIYPRIYHATHPQKPPPPAPSRVSCVLRTLATLTAAPAALPFAAENGPCHSERRVGMGPARKRAATQPIPRTARAAAHGGRTCIPTRKEGTKTPCSD